MPDPSARPSAQRTAARRRGLAAERAATLYLRVTGYRIHARQWTPAGRIPGAGEIDIIAQRGRTLTFVEVKARSDMSALADSVSQRQRQRIAKSANIYVQRTSRLADLDIRFDVILVQRLWWPRHIADAWRP